MSTLHHVDPLIDTASEPDLSFGNALPLTAV